MSSRRSRSRQSGASAEITDAQITDLVSKLQQLIPELRARRSDKVSAAKVLQETCNYIKNLHREVDDLSDRLSELLANTDSNNTNAKHYHRIHVKQLLISFNYVALCSSNQLWSASIAVNKMDYIMMSNHFSNLEAAMLEFNLSNLSYERNSAVSCGPIRRVKVEADSAYNIFKGRLSAHTLIDHILHKEGVSGLITLGLGVLEDCCIFSGLASVKTVVLDLLITGYSSL
ncbi:hypothetical protein V8G54_017393 [Vigna mungo]|uniref:BHLH domain-containing protein n=1 Tax=Vigna mungo TaxID=3915 RepID=A0AAQ3NQU7_VIGMU